MKYWLIPLGVLAAALSVAGVTFEDYATRADLEKDIQAAQTRMQVLIDREKWPEVAQAGQDLAERIGILAHFSIHLSVPNQDRIAELVIEVNETATRLAESAAAQDPDALSERVAKMKSLHAEIAKIFATAPGGD